MNAVAYPRSISAPRWWLPSKSGRLADEILASRVPDLVERMREAAAIITDLMGGVVGSV